MTADITSVFWPFMIFTAVLFIMGIYCILATYNMIRTLIGVELLIKAVTLLIIAAGSIAGRGALSQEMVITLIVVEVVVMVVAAGIVLGTYKYDEALDVRTLRDMKG
jgi:NADH:ubiquinone oxidoreductase subunit K